MHRFNFHIYACIYEYICICFIKYVYMFITNQFAVNLIAVSQKMSTARIYYSPIVLLHSSYDRCSSLLDIKKKLQLIPSLDSHRKLPKLAYGKPKSYLFLGLRKTRKSSRVPMYAQEKVLCDAWKERRILKRAKNWRSMDFSWLPTYYANNESLNQSR